MSGSAGRDVSGGAALPARQLASPEITFFIRTFAPGNHLAGTASEITVWRSMATGGVFIRAFTFKNCLCRELGRCPLKITLEPGGDA